MQNVVTTESELLSRPSAPPVPPPSYSTDTVGNLILDTVIEENGNGFPIFGVVGAAWYPLDRTLVEYIDEGKIEYIHASNESAGCYMAAYYGYVVGKVGVAITTAGPGTAMAVTAIDSIYNEEKSLVTFCGVPTDNFQYVNPSIMNPVAKAVFYIDPSVTDPQNIIKNAFEIARIGTNSNPGPGPVVIFVRVDSWNSNYILNPVNPYYLTYPDISSLLGELRSSVQNARVILRVGNRISKNNLLVLANLTTTYHNLYLHVVFAAQNNIDLSAYDRIGVEGPLGNTTINSHYKDADVIIEIGVGIIYPLVGYDNVLAIPDCSVKPTVKLYSIYDDPLTYIPNPNNSYYVDADYFVDQFVEHVVPLITSDVNWENDTASKNANQLYILNAYTESLTDNVYHSGTVLSKILYNIYDGDLFLNDEKLYVCDIGSAGFIAAQLLYHKKVDHIFSFDQFSPIGCAPPCAAGAILSGNYEDVVIFMGDGGFLNVPGYIIDLLNMAKKMNMRCLLFLMNDKHYANVSLAEIKLFGYSTSITSTLSIQEHLSVYNVAKALAGTDSHYVSATDITTSDTTGFTTLNNFVQNWYNKTAGFTDSGVYIVYYETTVLPHNVFATC